MPSGPGSTANEFGVLSSGGDDVPALQTNVSAVTEYPSWRGHVLREACTHLDVDDEDGDGDTTELAPACQPVDFPAEEIEETFGNCPQSRTWDAGECLALTPWYERRLYTHDANNTVIPVANADGTGKAVKVWSGSATGVDWGPTPAP